MKNPRIYEVAKELGISSQELRDKLVADGYDIKNNFNAVGPELLAYIRKTYDGNLAPQQTEKEEKNPDSGVMIEEKSSDLKPKQFVVRRVRKAEADEEKSAELKAKKLAEEQRLAEEAKRLEEARQAEELRKVEALKQVEEARKLEEERLQEQKRIEEAAKKKLEAEESARKKLEMEE